MLNIEINQPILIEEYVYNKQQNKIYSTKELLHSWLQEPGTSCEILRNKRKDDMLLFIDKDDLVEVFNSLVNTNVEEMLNDDIEYDILDEPGYYDV